MLRAVVALLVAVAAAGAVPSSWTPERWKDLSTLELTTQAPGEPPHTFPVWLVVVDGDLYVRLGSRAAGRVEQSTTAPWLGVTVGGRHFDHVRGVEAPEDAARVGEAMASKYWTDLLIRWFPHPLTLRLVPE
jgi:hypothetical protein